MLFLSSWPREEGWCELQGTVGSPAKRKLRVARTTISLDDKEKYTQGVLHTYMCGIHCEYTRLNVGIRYGVGAFVGHTHLSAVFGEPHLPEGMFPPSWESPVNQDQEQLCLVTPPLPLPFEQN